MPGVTLTTGLHAEVELTVADGDTATAVGSGDVPVLATPRLVALAEAAAVATVGGRLAEGETSVGVGVHLEHVKPSGVGATVSMRAELVDVNGRRLRFRFTAVDGTDVIGFGELRRVIVDRQRFLGEASD